MQFTVSKAAEILKVGRELIKRWAYHFSEYLEPAANPEKGVARKFSVNDILVLGYVREHWEDEPDFECIKVGLNREDHKESPYSEFATLLTPIFQDIPHDIEERSSSAALLVAYSEEADLYFLAKSYKDAGDVLVESAIENGTAYELIYPVIYNYRHSIELYLKASISNHQIGHSLTTPLEELKQTLLREFNATIPEWFENAVIAFNEYDPKGVSFRYGGTLPEHETFVDIHHLREVMGLLGKAFQRIRNERGLPC
jgi:hypothetical protein